MRIGPWCFASAFLLPALFPAKAQFGGREGDIVFYAVTAGGSAEIQAAAGSNSPQDLAAFRTTSLASVPGETSEPFPLVRQIFYTSPTETFAVGTYPENAYGEHRVFVLPLKVLVIGGTLNPVGNIFGFANAFVTFPVGLDIEGDVAVQGEVVAAWFAGQWSFEVVTDHRSSVGPPDLSGFEWVFQNPELSKFPAFLPWLRVSAVYAGSGFQPGIDMKDIDVDPKTVTTIRQIRLRPGTSTPQFRTPGHTHLFVLQGSGTVTPVGGATVALRKNDYAFLPENLVVQLANPRSYAAVGN